MERTFATTLRSLAPHLDALLSYRSEPEVERVWRQRQADVLEQLAPYLSLSQLPDALNSVFRIDGHGVPVRYGLL
jgi:hypothetical protein